MFNVNQSDLDFIFESAGESVSVNDEDKRAIVSRSPLKDSEHRYIHTIDIINRGDVVKYADEPYLIVSETVSKRGGKYKALMRHCNFSLKIPGGTEKVLLVDANGKPILDGRGRPQYTTIDLPPIDVHAIVDNKSFSLEGNQIRVENNQIILMVQDNPTNRELLVTDHTFQFEGTYKVVHKDFTQKGLMIISCDKTTG
ncbi:hypothetical protein NDQ57_03340 [Rossellomorea marisflavi]|uniref:hypothetical protein n=1 Tax=Rossellomorea marisflavi TaxID=189381 RepID=UPI002042039F|nr:hypothetical protein [Rossellomorea marisflavi]MCM2603736.1 hypothetical protein [Rossellomorea marisflavi]